MEGLAWVEVTQYHCEVDADADAGHVKEELNAGFPGWVSFYKDEVNIDKI